MMIKKNSKGCFYMKKLFSVLVIVLMFGMILSGCDKAATEGTAGGQAEPYGGTAGEAAGEAKDPFSEAAGVEVGESEDPFPADLAGMAYGANYSTYGDDTGASALETSFDKTDLSTGFTMFSHGQNLCTGTLSSLFIQDLQVLKGGVYVAGTGADSLSGCEADKFIDLQKNEIEANIRLDSLFNINTPYGMFTGARFETQSIPIDLSTEENREASVPDAWCGANGLAGVGSATFLPGADIDCSAPHMPGADICSLYKGYVFNIRGSDPDTNTQRIGGAILLRDYFETDYNSNHYQGYKWKTSLEGCEVSKPGCGSPCAFCHTCCGEHMECHGSGDCYTSPSMFPEDGLDPVQSTYSVPADYIMHDDNNLLISDCFWRNNICSGNMDWCEECKSYISERGDEAAALFMLVMRTQCLGSSQHNVWYSWHGADGGSALPVPSDCNAITGGGPTPNWDYICMNGNCCHTADGSCTFDATHKIGPGYGFTSDKNAEPFEMKADGSHYAVDSRFNGMFDYEERYARISGGSDVLTVYSKADGLYAKASAGPGSGTKIVSAGNKGKNAWVKLGNINGDDYRDIVFSAPCNDKPGTVCGIYWIAGREGLLDGSFDETTEVKEVWTSSTPGKTGSKTKAVEVGDIDDDGVDEIVTIEGSGSSLQLYYYKYPVSYSWYFADGTTKWGIYTYLLVANPNAQAAHITVYFMKENGEVVPKEYTVSANSRFTVRPNNLVELTSPTTDFSSKVTSDLPIVAERSMYWDNREDGHVTIGATSPSTTWYFGDGTTKWGIYTYLLILNPNAQAAHITVYFMKENGEVVPKEYTVSANSRFTVRPNNELPATDFSSKITSDLPIVAERSMYWNNLDGGHVTIGVPGGTGGLP